MATSKFWRLTLVFALSIGYLVPIVRGDVYSAIAGMEQLIETESILIGDLDSYIEALENKVTYMRQRILEYKKEHNEASNDITGYLSNPINAFLLTKRLASDWSSIENVMYDDTNRSKLCVDNYDLLEFIKIA